MAATEMKKENLTGPQPDALMLKMRSADPVVVDTLIRNLTSGNPIAEVEAAKALMPLVFAARSCNCSLANQTSAAMVWVQQSTPPLHGKWSSDPPKRIEAGQVGGWATESKGFATGTESWVTYQLEGTGGRVTFHWTVPYSGDNSARLDNNDIASHTGTADIEQGKDVAATFTLRRA